MNNRPKFGYLFIGALSTFSTRKSQTDKFYLVQGKFNVKERFDLLQNLF